MLRRTLFWAHLVVGLVAGLAIFSMAASGLLISYEAQILEWANRDLRVTPPTPNPNAPRLDVEALVARVRETHPEVNPTGITWKADPTAPVTLTVGREGVHYANPYTGDYLGQGAASWREFFHSVTEWHRFLTGSGLSRDAGKAITGAGCLLFGLLLFSGIYLWCPRQWRWVNLRAVTVFNGRLKGRARDWNWHNVFGFWSAIPLLFIILTGLVMSYGWANNLLFTLTGNTPPPPRERGPGGPGMAMRGERGPGAREGGNREGGPNGREGGAGPREGGFAGREGARGGPGGRGEGGPGGREGGGRPAGPPPSLAGLEQLLALAREQHPGWSTLSLRMPQKPGDPFPVMVDRGGRGQVHLRTMLNLDTTQGKVLPSPDDLSQQNLGRRLRMYSRYLHTGELFGVVGQTIAALCTVAALLLVWTGFALAWRRFFGRRRSAAAEPTAPTAPVVEVDPA